MAQTSSLNCLSCRHSYQTPHSLNASPLFTENSMRNITGRPGHRTMEMNGASSAPYHAHTPCVPLFCTFFNGGGSRRAFRLPGVGRGSFPLCGGAFARSYSVSKTLFFSEKCFVASPSTKNRLLSKTSSNLLSRCKNLQALATLALRSRLPSTDPISGLSGPKRGGKLPKINFGPTGKEGDRMAFFFRISGQKPEMGSVQGNWDGHASVCHMAMSGCDGKSLAMCDIDL